MTSTLKILALGLAAALATGAADARSLKWSRSGDALTLDPHAQNEGPTTNVNRQVYEPLVERDRTGALEPGLAVARPYGSSSCARA